MAEGTGLIRDFVTGVGLLGRGFALWARSPRLMLLGLLPALLAFAVLTTGFVVLCVFVGPVDEAITPFADGWAAGWRDAVRVVVGIALLGAALLVAVLSYTALTMAIGDPFYEKISLAAEEYDGGAPPEVEVAWWRSLGRAVREGLRTMLASLVTGVVLFAAGFIPVVGQTVVPVLGVLVGGWYLALELTGTAFERRGMRLADRRRVLRTRRGLALGLGSATFLLFMIPLGAVIVMPPAVAGATFLTRKVGAGAGQRGDRRVPS